MRFRPAHAFLSAALLSTLGLGLLSAGCGTLPITDEHDAECLVNLPFESAWTAALKYASLRSGTIREMKSKRTIQIDSDVDVDIILEPLTRNETRIYVRAVEAGGLKRDPDTARWVADGIYRQATQ